MRSAYKMLVRNLKGRGRFQNQGIAKGIILKWVLKATGCLRFWTVLTVFSIGSSDT